MPVVGIYLKDFPALPSAVADDNIIPIAVAGNQISYKTTVSGIITDARITSKLLTGLSVTGGAVVSTDTILQAFGKVQNQINGKQGTITLTTTGSSGAATLIGATLNVPNYTLSGLGGVPTSRTLTINGTTQDLSADRTFSVGTVTSVGLSMPSAFSVANSPINSFGTIAVTGAGLASQYIRGDGQLADFPTGGGGGGSSVSYYLNGSVNQGTFVGNTYYEMNKTPVLGAGTDFTIAADGYISQFITDANDPNSLLIPAGNWNFETYLSASSGGGTPSFYVELYKYNGTAFTLIASNSAAPELISFGTSIQPYFSALAVPETVLLATDRLAIRIYVTHSGRTITLHTENSHLCQVITTFTTGLQSLNGISKQAQFFAVGTSGTDFAISSSVDTHTFNLPTASATNRGALSSANWTTFNSKQNAITLTTTGTSGAATFIGSTLNIPDYSSGLTGYVPYTGATGAVNLGAFDLTVNSIQIGRGAGSIAFNTRVGTSSLNSNTTGTENTAIGYSTLLNNTIGVSNSVLGYGSMSSNTSGTSNVAIGATTLALNISGNTNIAIGNQAGNYSHTPTTNNESSSNSIYLGYDSRSSANGNINEIVIGHQGRGNGSNTVTIGNSSVTNNYFFGNIRGGAFIKTGGTSAQILAADGSVITAGTNITISGGVISASGGGGGGSGTVTSVSALTLGTTGTDLSSSVADPTTTPVITLNVPTASATNRGALSSGDWTTFNGKQNTITLTTTGTSGAATFISNTLNIPQYQSVLTNPVTGTGTTNELSYWATSSSIGSLSTATYPSLTELSYVKGVTSAIQTQLNLKQGTITLTTTGISGAATLIGDTLNIPQYAGGGNARNQTTFTATAAQTTFTVTYIVGQVDVYYNGSKLAPAEFTATNGTSIILATACQVGDIVDVIAYLTSVANGTTTNLLTFSSAGTGDAPGSTFNGSAARTLSYNSVGANKVITSGTAAPSGGVDGDIYLQYI